MKDEPMVEAPASLGKMVELSLNGGGLAFTREVPEATALQIMALAMGAPAQLATSGSSPPPFQPAVQPLPASGAGAVAPTILNETVGEFIARHQAQRNVEKIAAVAQFLKDSGQERFTSDQIKEQFPRAGEKVPGNFPRDFRWAVQSKWIAEDHQNPKTYYITNTGSGAVNQQFSKDIRKASHIKTPKRRGTNSAKNGDGDE